MKLWNEFIANKITLKCINKNGKIICFTSIRCCRPHLISLECVSASTFCYFSLPLCVSFIPPPPIFRVIVKVNILRYQGEISLALRTMEENFFQQFCRARKVMFRGEAKKKRKPVMGYKSSTLPPQSEAFFGDERGKKSKLSNITHNLMA